MFVTWTTSRNLAEPKHAGHAGVLFGAQVETGEGLRLKPASSAVKLYHDREEERLELAAIFAAALAAVPTWFSVIMAPRGGCAGTLLEGVGDRPGRNLSVRRNRQRQGWHKPRH